MVRGTVEEALNAMLDGEAAGRCERSETRQDTRPGSSERSLQTQAGEVKFELPKLRPQTFSDHRSRPLAVSNLSRLGWNRRVERDYIRMKRSWAGKVRNVSLLVASAINSEGF